MPEKRLQYYYQQASYTEEELDAELLEAMRPEFKKREGYDKDDMLYFDTKGHLTGPSGTLIHKEGETSLTEAAQSLSLVVENETGRAETSVSEFLGQEPPGKLRIEFLKRYSPEAVKAEMSNEPHKGFNVKAEAQKPFFQERIYQFFGGTEKAPPSTWKLFVDSNSVEETFKNNWRVFLRSLKNDLKELGLFLYDFPPSLQKVLIDKKYNCGPGNFRVSRKKGKWIEFATAVLDMDFDRMLKEVSSGDTPDRNVEISNDIMKAKQEYLLKIKGK